MPEKYLLLEDVKAHRKAFSWNPLAPVSYVDGDIYRGTLLEDLTEAEAKATQQYFTVPLNYKTYPDDTLRLFCKPEQVLQLNETQFNLLLGVKSTSNCYKALNILNWVEKLKVGYGVYVTIPNIHNPVRGVVRYVGSLPDEEGTKFGIEMLEERGQGYSDGVFKNIRYFDCAHDCAVFVAMDELSGPKPSQVHEIVPSQIQDAPLKLGNMVTFFDVKDNPVNGFVRWIGRHKNAEIVGIETKPLPAPIPGSVLGMDHMFLVNDRQGVKVFLPIDSVLRDDHNPPNATNQNQNEQAGYNYPDVSHHPNQSVSQSDPAAYNAVTGVPYDHSGTKSHGPRQRVSRKYELISGPPELKIGSLVKYDSRFSGTIKWLGYLPGVNGLSAGVETDNCIEGSTDGVYDGVRYFYSTPGKGIFVSCVNLRPITRSGTNAVVPQNSAEAKVLSISHKCDEIPTQSYQNLTSLENQVKQLQVDHSSHSSQLTDFNTTIEKHNIDILKSTEKLEVFEKALGEIQAANEYLKNQLSLTQQQLSDIQKTNTHLQNQLSSVNKSNELLQASNAHLQNQLSLTQQQLLGVQSMMTCSRLWVVSHDQFKIGREIGRGAWATVHETTFRGAKVAAKRLHDEITSPETIELFHREMEMALHCQHQNIVTFLGVTLENHPVILMELMDISLRSAYKRGDVKYQQVLKIFCDIASALHFLHTRPDPLIHRDVSSANVLLKDCSNEVWLAKLGDLGTAKLQQYCTTPGPGALAYAAPEVADPKRHSTKMDVYSFGVLVVEVLTKTLPFQNLNTLKGQVQQEFPQYHQLVTSCTNQQSSDRPTMYDVIGQLNKIKTIVSSTHTCS